MLAKQAMSPCPVKVDAGIPAAEALEMMGQRNIRHLPITDNGVLVGVLTRQTAELSNTVCKAFGACPPVGEVCEREPLIVRDDSDALDMIRTMLDKKLSYALVSGENDNLLGIFTTSDACRLLILLLEERGSK